MLNQVLSSAVAPAASAHRGPSCALRTRIVRPLLVAMLAFGPAASVSWAQQALAQGPQGVQVTDADMESEAARVPEAARRTVFSKPQNVSSAVSNLYTRRALALEAEKAGLDKNPQTAAALRIARDRVLSDARIAQIDAAAAPDGKALEAYARTLYNAQPQRFQALEEVRVRHILIRSSEPGAKATAEKLLAELKNGADFASLAREKSGDPGSAAQGGELGFIAKGKTVPQFEQAAFALQKPGELSPVVESSFGFHIIELEERKPAGVRPFEDVKEGLMADARNKVLEDARSAKSSALLKDANFNEAAIEAFSGRYR